MHKMLWVGLLWAQGPLWQVSVPHNAHIELGEDGNLLVMSGKEGVLALSGETGQVIWRCPACDRVPAESWRPLGPSPLWEGGTLSPPSQTESATGSFQNLQAALQPYLILNPYTGRIVYDADQMRRRMNRTTGRTVVPAARAVVLFGEGPKDPSKTLSMQVSRLMAVDVLSGNVLWEQLAGDEPVENLYSNLAVHESTIYYLTQRALYAVDARTGQKRWRQPFVKRFNLRPMTGTYVFIDEERNLVCAYGRGRLIAVRQDSGEPAWEKPIPLSRDNVLLAFSTAQGLLLFTDDLPPGSTQRPTGNALLTPPLAFLLDYETGQNRWGERLKTPGLLAGYIPLSEDRIFLLFQRERVFTSGRNLPDDWAVEVDVLDLKAGRFLFKRPKRLIGTPLAAQNVPGGLLVQTTRRIQYLSEEGEVLWEKPLKRRMNLPFAVRSEGSLFQAYIVDETGQVYRWDGPGTTPQPIGQPLKLLLSDPAQGIAWEKGRLWIWNGSSLWGLNEQGQVVCSFERPAPAFSPLIRFVGGALSLAGYAASTYLTFKAIQTVAPDPQSGDRPSLAISLKKTLTATGYAFGAVASAFMAEMTWEKIVQRRTQRMGTYENLHFSLGMEDNKNVAAYLFDKSRCELRFKKVLGPLRLSATSDIEVDPFAERLYLLSEGQVEAYSFAP